jgi:hypothetical protein
MAMTVGITTSGVSASHEGWAEKEFAYTIEHHGYVVVETGRRPIHHNMVGVGVGHNDARFAEDGKSMAAYYENGEAFGGRWWENRGFHSPVQYYLPNCPGCGLPHGIEVVKSTDDPRFDWESKERFDGRSCSWCAWTYRLDLMEIPKAV